MHCAECTSSVVSVKQRQPYLKNFLLFATVLLRLGLRRDSITRTHTDEEGESDNVQSRNPLTNGDLIRIKEVKRGNYMYTTLKLCIHFHF